MIMELLVQRKTKVAFTMVAALCVHLILVWIAWALAPSGDKVAFTTTVLIEVTGASVGWLVGFLASPRTKVEEKWFAKYSATISAFVSGFLLAKLDSSIALVFEHGNLLAEPIYGARVLIFISSTIVGALTIYVFRLYAVSDSEDQKIEPVHEGYVQP